MSLLVFIAIAQGIYYFITGVWPIADIYSFMYVTGPKMDTWLVQTVGAFVIVISLVLISAGLRKNFSMEIILLAIGSAVAFILVDVIFVLRDTINEIYLLDAGAELVIIVFWIIGLIKSSNESALTKED